MKDIDLKKKFTKTISDGSLNFLGCNDNRAFLSHIFEQWEEKDSDYFEVFKDIIVKSTFIQEYLDQNGIEMPSHADEIKEQNGFLDSLDDK